MATKKAQRAILMAHEPTHGDCRHCKPVDAEDPFHECRALPPQCAIDPDGDVSMFYPQVEPDDKDVCGMFKVKQ